MEIDDPYRIIGFKRQLRYTNVDYRSKLALAADEVTTLREISCNIDSMTELQWTVIACIQSLQLLHASVTFNEENFTTNNRCYEIESDISMSSSSTTTYSSYSWDDSSNSDDTSTWSGWSSYRFDAAVSNVVSNSNLLMEEDNNMSSYVTILSIYSALLGCSMRNLDMFCNSLLNLTAIRKHEWDDVQLTINTPKRNRTILELGDTNCYNFTRFRSYEL